MNIISQNTTREQRRKNEVESPLTLNLSVSADTIITSKKDLKFVINDLIEQIQIEQSTDAVLTLPEAANFMKLSLPTMRKLVLIGKIPSFRSGQIIRVYKKDLLNLVDDSSVMKGAV